MKSFKLLVLSVTGAVFNGIAGLVAARTLGPLQFGSFASAIAAITVLQVLLQGFQFSSQNEFERHDPADLSKDLNLRMWMFRNFLPLFVSITVLLFAFRGILNFTFAQTLGIVAMIFPTLALSAISGFHLWEKDLVKYQLLSSQVALIRLALSTCFAFLIFLSPRFSGPAVFILALILANNIVVAINWFRNPNVLQARAFVVKKEALHFVVIITASWLLMQGDIIVLNSTLDPEVAGVYAAYSSLAKVVIAFFGIYGLHLAARYSGKTSLVERFSVTARSAAVASLLIFLTMRFGEDVIALLYGSSFEVENVSVELLYVPSAIWAVYFTLLYMRINTIRGLFIPIAMIVILLFAALGLTTISPSIELIYGISTISGALGLIVLVFKK
jgi:hypothetical protein